MYAIEDKKADDAAISAESKRPALFPADRTCDASRRGQLNNRA
jgi:hypothetical protein